ncbi:PAAR domain-containing protein [Niabella insulamsoli]|uniref:PAAR domain-containing protein n=1 Tax=Niabella insulamsoli TaxID=3144874 RepID=UPI0031FC6487
MPPAARVGDMHVCPMWDGPKPHVGGPVMPAGVPNVLIGGMPAATAGGLCACAGVPDTIIKGSAGVLIGGMPAARMGDPTAHGGTIVMGLPTVLIGEAGGGGGGGGTAVSSGAGKPKMAPAQQQKNIDNSNNLQEAAKAGLDEAPKNEQKDYTAQFSLVDGAGQAMSNVEYSIKTSDGQTHDGKTDGSGKTQVLSGYTDADCHVSFLNT